MCDCSILRSHGCIPRTSSRLPWQPPIDGVFIEETNAYASELAGREDTAGLGGRLLGQPPSPGFSPLAWLRGGRRDAARVGVSVCCGPAFPAHWRRGGGG